MTAIPDPITVPPSDPISAPVAEPDPSARSGDAPVAAADPYGDLAAYQAVRRTAGLHLSPDGSRLVTTVAALDSKGVRWVPAVWEVDPTGEQPARRLSRSSKGETAVGFASDGDVLFTSARPDAEGGEADDDAPAALWLLPHSGEARLVGTRPGGIGALQASSEAPVVVALSDTLPAAADGEQDTARRTARKDAKVSAVLHDAYPVRYWDHDLGVGQNRFLAGALGDEPIIWRDLTPAPGRALHEASFDVSADGRTAVTTWSQAEPRGARRSTLVVVDVATGEQRALPDDGSSDDAAPQLSPDGRQVAFVRESRSTPTAPPEMRLLVGPVDGSAPARDVAPGWDRWPTGYAWTPDGSALLVTADEGGRAPVFRVELEPGQVMRLTTDDGHYSSVRVAPDGATAYALRDAIDAAPAPVRLDARTPGEPTPLQGPPTAPSPPGRLTEVETTAEDGTGLRAWLVLPDGEGPHPLLVWVHGGPLSSWNGWSWRWNPWLMAARGWAVLLPDPGLSTGYGQAMIGRGWGAWGAEPYTDVMALTDAALQHDGVDESRIALMGGSFGGYMANWVAGHTDRFVAIVTHASLWDLEQFGPTTDAAYYWSREMTPQMSRDHSPSRYADQIRTPMLVIHGDKDYRVPIGEGLRLWWDLMSRVEDPAANPHRFLYLPDENHWVLTPQHATIWYETVLAFLTWHVHGQPWQVPELLR